ncbi:VOC family protein [Gracilibacillus phocaeensis]|uniref:VOC family protein n=1 Tax=Gracilibacillus phocaeensis TaxID=2042304 RepID=UPI00102F6C67|nr:VOC family protein [Gracilibacillus phocaeensis]
MLTNQVSGLQHIGIPAYSLNESIAFYHELGFSVVYKKEKDSRHPNVAFVQLYDLIIELYEERAVLSDGSINHFALNVNDVQEVWNFVQRKGWSNVSKSVEYLPFWENGIRYFVIEGPNKEKIEFCEYV